MGVAADTTQASEPSLAIRGVLRDTTRIYRGLFVRSFVTGFVVFAVLGLMDVIVPLTQSETVAAIVGLMAAVAAFVGTTFVQGALVDAVDSEHRGVPMPAMADLYRRSWRRLGALVEVSIRTGLGVGLALFLLIVPGVLLAIRWALAAPVVMLEGLDARSAMRRSRELVRGHRGAVFRVLLNVWGRAGVAWFVLDLVLARISATSGHPLFSFWLGSALASALVTPYAGHAMSVLYYRLTDPDRPVIAEKPQNWHSIWHEHESSGDSTSA
jgi:hypothetical protein